MSGIRHSHRRQDLGTVALILSLLLAACAASVPQLDQSADQPDRQVTGDSPAQPVPGNPLFDGHDLKKAAVWYGKYHTFAPDDLLGLKRLAEVCTVLEESGVDDESCRKWALQVSDSMSQPAGKPETPDLETDSSPAQVIRAVLEARTDDRRVVAELVGVSVQSVELGPNLVGDQGILMQDTPLPLGSSDQGSGYGLLPGWSPHTWANREPFERALFACGVDDFALLKRGDALEIEGLWIQSDERRESARHGLYSDEILFESDAVYMFSFDYRTTGVKQGSESSSVRVKEVLSSEFSLPRTFGQWRHVVLLVRNGQDSAVRSRLLLRSWMSGDVQFGQVMVKKVFIEDGNGLHSRVLAAIK